MAESRTFHIKRYCRVIRFYFIYFTVKHIYKAIDCVSISTVSCCQGLYAVKCAVYQAISVYCKNYCQGASLLFLLLFLFCAQGELLSDLRSGLIGFSELKSRQKSRFWVTLGWNGSLTSKCNFTSELFGGEKSPARINCRKAVQGTSRPLTIPRRGGFRPKQTFYFPRKSYESDRLLLRCAHATLWRNRSQMLRTARYGFLHKFSILRDKVILFI